MVVVVRLEVRELETMSSRNDNDSVVAFDSAISNQFHKTGKCHSGVRTVEKSRLIGETNCVREFLLCALFYQTIALNN